MNWGTKIFLTLGVFMVGMVMVGIYMVTSNTDSLEYTDYYERGINYDEVFERRQNLQTQQAKPGLMIEDDTLSVRFTQRGNKGEVYFKRASDASRDIEVPFSLAGNLLQLPLDSLIRGVWDVKIEWTSGMHDFLYEEQVFLD